MRATRLLCGVVALLLLAACSASAKEVELYAHSATFDGSDAVGVKPGNTAKFYGDETGLAIDQASGNLYAYVEGAPRPCCEPNQASYIYKFDLAGASQPFSAPSIFPSTVIPIDTFVQNDLAVDNNGTATQGRMYAVTGTSIRAFLPSGIPDPDPNFPLVPKQIGEAATYYCSAAVAPDGNIWGKIFQVGEIREYTPSGELTGRSLSVPEAANGCDLEIDSLGNFYFASVEVEKYSPLGVFQGTIDPGPSLEIGLDHSNGDLFVATGGTDPRILRYNAAGKMIGTFGLPEGSFEGVKKTISGIEVDEDTHSVYVASHENLSGFVSSVPRVDVFHRSGLVKIPTVTVTAPLAAPTGATLHGLVDPDGIDTTDCYFEWGTTLSYGKKVDCAEGKVFAGESGDNEVSAEISGLTKGVAYHFRLVATNGNGIASRSDDFAFKASGKPILSEIGASEINTDGVRLGVRVNPDGGDTSYRIEWGPEAGVYGNVVPAPDGKLASSAAAQSFSHVLTGLGPGITYHYRVAATNFAGTIFSPDRTFTTFAPDSGIDPCPNAHVRQQTGAALLLDCRAYELVSAADAGGNDVESDLLPGQVPLVTSPGAADRLLYSIHQGMVPGVTGNPTNFGRDPYLATRGGNRWSTRYVGLPADAMAEKGVFASPLLGFDSALEQFAFGGKDVCDPCFADGSTNIPLRRPDGGIVKGMAGSLDPAADPTGRIGERFSADGSHLVFGSDSRFEPAGNEGETSIYDRNLKTGTTQVVSTLPGGQTMTGDVAALDVSGNGSRIVVASAVSTDPLGNAHDHPYLHLGSSPESVDLAPGATSGVLYAGMSADGSRVFYTSKDRLLEGDTDHSVDLYEAGVDDDGALALRLLSIRDGAPSNDDGCRPPRTLDSTAWNTAPAERAGDCSALTLAGGAGVAADGTLFFLSPERLDGEAGASAQPNLYRVEPGGDPRFIATIDSSLARAPKPPPSYPTANSKLVVGLTGATGVAVDATGSVYVLDNKKDNLRKYDSSGAAQSFSAGSNAATNTLTGIDAPTGKFALEDTLPTQIAVDRDNGFLYVPDYSHGVVDKFSTAGAYLSQLSVPQPVGVAVDPSNGALYVASGEGAVHVFDVSGAPLGILPIAASSIAVDSVGTVYGVHEGKASAYEPSGALREELVSEGARNIAIDATGEYPYDGDVYVDLGDEIAVFDPSGNAVVTFTGGELLGSAGLAVGPNRSVLAVRAGARIVKFGFEDPPFPEIAAPMALNALGQAGTHDYSDFQTSPDGRFAAFASRLALTDYDNLGHTAIYRYDASEEELDCATCPPTGAAITSDAPLSPYGLGLSSDGKVFFTSSEPLVLRDTNQKKDAYQWSSGAVQLISTGSSPSDSGMLSISTDGTDAFFFTRQTLVAEDQNGATVKIYDARAGGGFPHDPPPPPCAASDECHGPGTVAPAAPPINTATGAGGPSVVGKGPTNCRKGSVKRRGKCVKKPGRKSKAKKHRRGANRHG